MPKQNKLTNSRCLVTGGAGFIGSNLVDRLIYEGVKEVIVLDNFIRGRKENLELSQKSGKLKLVKGDIRNKKLVKSLVQGVDFVFHNAVIRLTQAEENPELCLDVMVLGTLNLLMAITDSKVKKLIFSSSATVYGDPSYLPIDENHPFNTKSIYGSAKVQNEIMLVTFKKKIGLDYVILRYFNVYGPRADRHTQYTEIIPRWLNRLKNNLPPEIYGNPKKCYDFTEVSDIIEANILAAKSNITEGIYNIGTGQGTDLKTLAALMINVSGKNFDPIYGPEEKRVIVSKRVAAVGRAKKDLGFEAKIDLQTGLKKYLNEN